MSTTTIGITGMTCGHCVSAVKNELSELPGVENVDVDLVNGGTSTATISSSTPLDAASIDEAVAEAGYTVVPAGS
ncbi:heavy-metal-associated domain-containing protein [Arthrobacter sedimenti]|uniref:heavy-metal-associated domain-containing protein n=1 Tax=Arthrobacter sedimenti TaxID=2694931 RepID=UPI000B35AB9B|nr:heavy-metal-associated domain-containing protein [Arthrobacter sedimenti]OUM45440.1 heavy metal transporter [Arthrobacter agilis]